MFGRGTAGDVVRVWKRTALHLSQHTLLIQEGLQEACITVKLHQVKDLQMGKQKDKKNGKSRSTLYGDGLHPVSESTYSAL